MLPLPSAITRLGSVLASGFHELHTRPKGQVFALDALRSFAILLVVGTHWGAKEYVEAGGVPTPIQNFPLFYYGWTGVDLFFVLSGFLIGKQLWRELDTSGTIAMGRFLLRRGLRIWPIYFVMLAYYALFSTKIDPRWSDWVFLSNYFPAGFTRGWSLSTEEMFYIAVPALLLIFRKRIPLARYAWVLLGIEAVLLVVRHFEIVDVLAAGRRYERADYELIYPFHTHLEGLLAGLLIALLAVTRPAVFDRKEGDGISKLGLSVFVGGTLLALILRATYDELFSFVTLGLIYGGMTFWVLLDRSWLVRPLNAWIWYPISRLSYGMYINHWWALPESKRAIVRFVQSYVSNPTVVFLVTLAMGILISIAFAIVTFVLIEHPFMMLRDRYVKRAKPVRTHSPDTVATAA